jgi:DNA-directed RNA polymerase specialized sigma subunit
MSKFVSTFTLHKNEVREYLRDDDFPDGVREMAKELLDALARITDLEQQLEKSNDDAERLLDAIENSIHEVHHKRCKHYRNESEPCDCGSYEAVRLHYARVRECRSEG